MRDILVQYKYCQATGTGIWDGFGDRKWDWDMGYGNGEMTSLKITFSLCVDPLLVFIMHSIVQYTVL